MLCKPLYKNIKAIICLYVFTFLLIPKVESQSVQPFFALEKSDRMIDAFQANDSVLHGILSNAPEILSTSFTMSQDSIVSQVYIVNLNSKQTKIIPLKGNADSLEFLLQGSSFSYNNEFYFLTRRLSRSNPPIGNNWITEVNIDDKLVYKVVNDSIELVTRLNVSIPNRDINIWTFVNEQGNFVTVLGDQNFSTSLYRLGEYTQNGVEVNLSQTFSAVLIRSIIQNPVDSTYRIFPANSSVLKLDQSFQVIDSNETIRELNTSRIIQPPYFQSKISANPVLSGKLINNPAFVGDSISIASYRFINDTTFVCNWKKLITYNAVNQNYSDYIFHGIFNTDNFNDQYFYAYDKKQCIPGSLGCLSKFMVVKHDTLNNTNWELEFGNDAGYHVLKTLALKDSGCVVFVNRTDDIGNVDLYYVHIDKDGNVTNNFLPVLGGEELSIPVKVVFSLYPNPSADKLTLDNLKLAEKAKQIYIINMSGIIVTRQEFQKTIDISTLDSGNYIYRVEDNTGSYNETKFIKN